MDEYKSGNVGLEAGRLPDDLKHWGRRMADRDEVARLLLGVIGAAIFIGFLLGQLWR